MSSDPPPWVVRCRSCHAPIVWLWIRPSGRRMPVDAKPSPRGNVRADFAQSSGVVVPSAEPGERLYLSHFVTCPDAKKWRRRA